MMYRRTYRDIWRQTWCIEGHCDIWRQTWCIEEHCDIWRQTWCIEENCDMETNVVYRRAL